MKYIVNLCDVNLSDVNIVGGKNASTGEMLQNLVKAGVNVPDGFATTVDAYQQLLLDNNLDQKIAALLKKTKPTNLKDLNKASKTIRTWITKAKFSREFESEITKAYSKFKNTAVAVRSSATTEDLEGASFAGAQETFLNVKGIKHVLHAIKLVFASLFTTRALAYRADKKFDHHTAAISVGIQPMVRSDKGASGVIFTMDTESGFDKVILITGSYGLGEAIVQGKVTPDEFIVYKPSLENKKFAILQRQLGIKKIKMVYTNASDPHKFIKEVAVTKAEQAQFCLSDKDIEALARQALIIEKHYGKPMDIEWAKDGISNELFILQARAETVNSLNNKAQSLELYSLPKKGKVLASGQSIGQRIGSGKAKVILDLSKMRHIEPGHVLVTDMTDPDWEPVMKLASAIVTNRGGRTCHAAIIARELGIPAVIGCGDATKQIKDNEAVTVSCAEGQVGYIYAGELPYKREQIAVGNMPKLPVKICMNLGNPEIAFTNQFLPNEGVGLARLEFVISHMIGIHPNAALDFKKLPKKLQSEIAAKTAAYKNPVEYYIERLREGISMISGAFYPKEVIYRFSDFKSNEYANLLGGRAYEPVEENPMIGFRGASRYHSENFRKCFELECKAFVRVREDMGLLNAQLMVPFVRTVAELKEVIALMESYGLARGKNGLKLYMMCEVPSNVVLAKEFLQYVDGFSIGSNDLTQLTLGLDRDSSLVAPLFDERNEAVKILLKSVIMECNNQRKYIGICGQAPSDYPDFADWLMQQGIQAMSLNPDTVVSTWLYLGKEVKATLETQK